MIRGMGIFPFFFHCGGRYIFFLHSDSICSALLSLLSLAPAALHDHVYDTEHKYQADDDNDAIVA